MLEHTEDPGGILALLRSWLKVDGMLIVEVPNIESTCQAPRSTFHEAHLYNFNVVSLRRLAKKHGMHEAWHLISRDGGNITMCLTPSQPSLEGSCELVIPGNYEWVSRIVRGHSNLRRHLTPLPYLRAWQRLYRSLMERRETVGATSGKALLDQLYSLQLRSYFVSQT
ncbi:MAG: class I SAM-dependent methyltransferase [Nitrospira sp.]|nr:class I SAM-dependent methyltransferase [Nitrospira sp.]